MEKRRLRLSENEGRCSWQISRGNHPLHDFRLPSALRDRSGFRAGIWFQADDWPSGHDGAKTLLHCKKIGEHTDEQLRPWFFGGRVECLAGAGHFVAGNGGYKLYDVNSMYPSAMANGLHT